ncbi:MAG: glycosyltransferase [Acholeplasmatales bacterium]|nr:glycosyltransferase [Acholeplasmatales bacterium]
MKKILHIPNYYNPHTGGIEQTTEDFVNSIKGEYDQRVLCFKDAKGTITEEVNGILVTRVGCQAKLMSQSIAYHYKREMKRLMTEFQPDVVVFHFPNPYVARYLMKYLKNKKFKFILYWHLDITKQKVLGKLFKKQTLNLLNYADKIISTSPNYVKGSEFLPQFENKIKIIPSCVNESRVEVNDEINKKALEIKKKYEGKNIIFAFGRHVEYKGLTYLIKASKLLDDSYVVLIGGSGPLTDELKKEAEADKKVSFLGRLSLDDLKAHFVAADIFAFPSITKNEAFGLGLAEAMGFGKPTVTFTIDGSGVNYVALKDVTCLEVPNRDFESYAEALKTLANNNELKEKFSLNARKRFEEILTYNKYVLNIKELLKEVVGNE